MASSSELNKLFLKLKGIYTSQNPTVAVPDGALLRGENIVIDKEDIGEIRRGFKIFGSAMGNTSTNVAKQLVPYKNRILRHYEPSTDGYLQYQNTAGGSTFTTFNVQKMLFASSLTRASTTATFTTTEAHGLKIGETVVIDGATEPEYNGTFTVLGVPSSTQFTYTVAGAPATPATGAPVLIESTLNNFREPVAGTKVKYVEVNKNLYLTSNKGVKKIDDYNSTMVNSGIPKALDINLELYDAEGFFSQQSQVGYRVLWGIKDRNDNLILGAASERAFISNPGLALLIANYNDTVTKLNDEPDITLTYTPVAADTTLPDLIIAMNDMVTDLNAEPNLSGTYVAIAGSDLEEVQEEYNTGIIDILNGEANLDETYDLATTSQQVKLFVTVPEGITAAHFYQIYRTGNSVDLDTPPNEDYQLVYESNPTLEQIESGVLDIVDITPDGFRGAALYQNTNQEGDAQANEPPPFALDVALYNGMMFYGNTKTRYKLAFSLVGMDSLSSSTELIVDNGTDDFTLTFSTVSENTATGQVLISDAASVSTQIDETARSIVRVINRFPGNTLVNAYYLSTPDGVPGSILLEGRSVSDAMFELSATNQTQTIDGNVYSAFSPELVEPEESENDDKPNRVYYSKLQEPEAVPSLNYFNVGGGDNSIYRLASLRDGLFIFSQEGIFKVVGDAPAQLNLSAFDNTTILKAPESVAIGNNQIYLFTDQGICTVSDTGVNIISRQIEDQLLTLLDPAYEDFSSATFGVFYQSDRKYIINTVTDPDDEYSTQAFVYNVITNTWVKWTINKSSGLVNPYDDRLYWGAADTNFIEQERKNFAISDHADREHNKNIVSYNRAITAISQANPTQITCNYHGLNTGDTITIFNSNSTPSIDGEHEITFIDLNTFSIDVNVTVAGTSGIWTSSDEDIPVKLELDSLTNVGVGDSIAQENEQTVNSTTYDYLSQCNITAVDLAEGTVTISKEVLYTVGPCIVYDAIPVLIEWIPIHAGDPSVLKQFREAHVMFDDFRAGKVVLKFNSDIQRNIEEVNFILNIFWGWGKFPWGKLPWGGIYTFRNLRTYIPFGKQRCRLLTVRMEHLGAFDKWKLEGVSLFYKPMKVGERTNR